MNLQYFSQYIVPILQLVVTAAGLLSLFLFWWQVRQTAQWNKVQSHHAFFTDRPNPVYERAVHDALKEIGVSAQEPLTADAVQKIVVNDDALFATRNYLNEWEEICCAIRVGILDSEYAYAMNATVAMRAYRTYKLFIDYWRLQLDEDEIWIELEKTALEWAARKSALKVHQSQLSAEMKKQIEDQQIALTKQKGLGGTKV